MISPDENQLPVPEGQRGLQTTSKPLNDSYLPHTPDFSKDFVIDCEFSCWPPLVYQISYTFSADKAIDTIRVWQCNQYGDPLAGGFVLSDIPAGLQDQLEPLAISAIGKDSRLLAIVEATERFNRSAERSALESICYFKKVTPPTKTNQIILSPEERQTFIDAGIAPPDSGTRIDGQGKITTLFLPRTFLLVLTLGQKEIDSPII